MSIFVGGRIMVPPERHKEVREAILDGKVPITKIIGFSIQSQHQSSGVTAVTSRNHLLLENTMELMNNLSAVIFLPHRDPLYNSYKMIVTKRPESYLLDEVNQPVYSTAETFNSANNGIEVLDESILMYTPQGDVTLRLVLHEGTGITSFEESLEIVNASAGAERDTYLGIPQVFNLGNYIRILPPINGVLKYRLYNGMTDEQLNRFWDNYEAKKKM